MVTCISKGACSGPVELTREDREFALSAGSIDDLRVQLVQAAYSDRHGDWARGIAMSNNGTWRVDVYRGARNSRQTVMGLQCVRKEVAQEVRDACCIILGEGWVAGSQLTQTVGPALQSCSVLFTLCIPVVVQCTAKHVAFTE